MKQNQIEIIVLAFAASMLLSWAAFYTGSYYGCQRPHKNTEVVELRATSFDDGPCLGGWE